MEIIASVEYNPDQMDAENIRFADRDRASGLHASQVIQSFSNTHLRSKSEQRISFLDMTSREKLEMYFHTEIGFIWEAMLSHYFRNRMISRRVREVSELQVQMPLSLDGIHLTPDGVDVATDPWWLEEYKATKKSMIKWEQNPEKYFFDWLAQIKMYLKAIQSRHCRLFVYWVVGDWSRRGPSMMRPSGRRC